MQRVAVRRRTARVEIGVDVGGAEGVDRLLRVADEDQPGLRGARRGAGGIGRRLRIGRSLVRCLPGVGHDGAGIARPQVDRAEDLPLQRVGVLALVDQRERIAIAQRCREAATPFVAHQRVAHDAQQVVVVDRPGARLQREAPFADVSGHLDRHSRRQRVERVAQGFEPIAELDQLELGHRLVALGPAQLLAGEVLQLRGQQSGADVGAVGERGELGETRFEPARPPARRPGRSLSFDEATHLRGVARERDGEPLPQVVAFGGDRPPVAGLRHDRGAGSLVDRAHRAHQRLRRQRGGAQCPQRRGRSVLHRFAPPRRDAALEPRVAERAGLQALRDADRQRVLVDHRVAEAVDRSHLRLVDLRERHAQPSARLLQVRDRLAVGQAEDVVDQAADAGEPVRDQALERLDAFPDAARELGSGRAGEGHHQDPIDGELALDQRAHDQAGDRPGLAGAGVGLQQVEAAQDFRREHRMTVHHAARTIERGVAGRAAHRPTLLSIAQSSRIGP